MGFIPQGGFSYKAHTGPVKAPPMPDQFSVSLKDSFEQGISVTAANNYRKLGLVETLNQNPKFMSELFRMYRYCRITSVTVKVESINQGVGAAQVVLAVIPNSGFAGLTSVTNLAEIKGAKTKILSPAGGMDRCTNTIVYNADDAIGNASYSKYWMTSAQSLVTTPIDAEEPVFVLGTAIVGAGPTYVMSHRVITTYHCQFFDLRSDTL